mmetsp:Transcript_29751/g.88351  ORF Transcript_29751/g.88351 Transcript_29751/m.88351 type:complete len:267 (+) Transcript_29751:42-842(+)
MTSGSSLGHLGGAVLDDAELDAVALGQRDPRLGALADDEDVLQARGEGVAHGILDVDDLEGARVPLAVGDGAHTADVVTAADHHGVAGLEGREVQDLAGLEVHAHRVVDLDRRVRVAQRAAVVGDRVGGALGAAHELPHAAELVGGLLLDDLVDREAALGVVEQAEVLLGLLDLHDVHEARREEHVGAHLAVHLDEALHDDHLDLVVGQGVLQALAEHDDEGHALAHPVGARRRLRGPAALQLVQHPVAGREHALQVLLRSARHGC